MIGVHNIIQFRTAQAVKLPIFFFVHDFIGKSAVTPV